MSNNEITKSGITQGIISGLIVAVIVGLFNSFISIDFNRANESQTTTIEKKIEPHKDIIKEKTSPLIYNNLLSGFSTNRSGLKKHLASLFLGFIASYVILGGLTFMFAAINSLFSNPNSNYEDKFFSNEWAISHLAVSIILSIALTVGFKILFVTILYWAIKVIIVVVSTLVLMSLYFLITNFFLKQKKENKSEIIIFSSISVVLSSTVIIIFNIFNL